MNGENNTTMHEATTRADERSERVKTAVTIDWSNISIEDTRRMAARTVIIAAQSQWRAEKEIPTEVTLDANDFANPQRKPRGPVDIRKLLEKMDPAQRAALLEQYA